VLLVDLEIRTRRTTPPVARIAEDLRALCVPAHLDATVTLTGAHEAQLAIEPSPGRTDLRKLRGCLEDFVLDRTLARIVGEVEVEAGSA
jgi:hypothetical protein